MHCWLQSMYASLDSSGMKTWRWKCIPWLIVISCSTINSTNFTTPISVANFYLNRIPIRTYSMTYLTGRIVTCIEITVFQRKGQFSMSFFDSVVYVFSISKLKWKAKCIEIKQYFTYNQCLLNNEFSITKILMEDYPQIISTYQLTNIFKMFKTTAMFPPLDLKGHSIPCSRVTWIHGLVSVYDRTWRVMKRAK